MPPATDRLCQGFRKERALAFERDGTPSVLSRVAQCWESLEPAPTSDLNSGIPCSCKPQHVRARTIGSCQGSSVPGHPQTPPESSHTLLLQEPLSPCGRLASSAFALFCPFALCSHCGVTVESLWSHFLLHLAASRGGPREYCNRACCETLRSETANQPAWTWLPSWLLTCTPHCWCAQ